MSRILVAYDSSKSSKRALDRAIEEARSSHAEITVIAVAEMPLNPDEPRFYGTLDDFAGNEGDALAPPPDLVDHLTEARDHLASAGLEADLAWAAGLPAREIVSTAKRVGAKVIILGEHHHGMLSGLFGNDVDTEVQREAPGCTVILA
jgi:nucleotide-binding universal stress UspA family protein